MPGLDITQFLITMLILVLSVAVHEFAHAWAADRLGDPTARYQGRLTLNPAVHLDPMGTAMMVFSAFTGYGFGWGKPVPVNPRYLRYGPRLGFGIVAAAGPLSNLLQAVLWAIPLRLGGPAIPAFFQHILLTGVVVNIILCLFNLIPLYPLDGYNILRGILSTVPTRWAYDLQGFLDRLQPYGPMIFLLVILVDQMTPLNILGRILGPLANALFRLLL